MMRAYERLLRYVTVRTPSDESSASAPSSECQFELAKLLVEELKGLGLSDARVDDKCYVYATLEASKGCEDKMKLGLIAHMDTVSDFCQGEIRPVVTDNFDGGDVKLGAGERVLTVKDFPHLPSLKGRTLITTDGTTVLGADDKAGIAEIMTLLETLIEEGIPHGQICVAFTPDEEIGRGADYFDVQGFGAEYAYTLDGGPEGEIQYENFNACKAHFHITGFNVHPGESKDTMINALLVAMELNALLPSGDIPRLTEEYEGFYHLYELKGDVSAVDMTYLVRDHSDAMFEARKEMLKHVEKVVNEKYGAGTAELAIEEQYRNMVEHIRPCMHLITNAEQAAKEAGIEPVIRPIRGGTDGAALSYKGLPCPNLGTGGYAYHGPYEHITVEAMDQVVDMLVRLVGLYAR